jgi:hypothetical protein
LQPPTPGFWRSASGSAAVEAMARPRKEEHERRTPHLPPVRMTDAELIAIGDQARAAGLSLSDFVRQRLTQGRVTPKPGLVDARLLCELNRAASTSIRSRIAILTAARACPDVLAMCSPSFTVS